MSRKLETVRTLAQSADLDLDEALIALWDAGLDWIKGPNDRLPSRDVDRARLALGLTIRQRQTRVSWWVEKTSLNFEELSSRALALGIDLVPGARKLPKGALKKFIAEFPDAKPDIEAVSETVVPKPVEPFVLEQVGSTPPRRHLNEETVEMIHQELVIDACNGPDPIFPPGVKSPNLLSSALTRPQTQFSDELKYETIEMAGAALLHSIIQNHPFFNGNKRAGFVSLLLFLEQNGYDFDCDEDEVFRFLMRVSSHKLCPDIDDSTRSDREVVMIAHWIKDHIHPAESGDRVMSWFKLRSLLRNFECEFAIRRGSRIEIRRSLEVRGDKGRIELLKTKVPYGGDGRDVQMHMIQKIRKELKLDEDSGVDTYSFYGGKPVNAIIVDYRGILRRLGKV